MHCIKLVEQITILSYSLSKYLPTKRCEFYIDHGNVGSCGVPLTLAKLIEKGRIQSGDRAGLMGIGSGLNVMMLGVQW